MAKIIAHFSKKASGQAQYSSNQFSASVEIESDTDDPDAMRNYLRRCFEIVKSSVDEQMRGVSASTSQPIGQRAIATTSQPRPANGYRNGGQINSASNHRNGNGNGAVNGHFPTATQAQQKAVFAICKALGHDPNQYDLAAMSVSQTSKLIDELKAQQAGTH